MRKNSWFQKKVVMSILSILFLCVSFFSIQKEKPILAVLNLDGKGIERIQADIITGFVEEAFFNTAIFKLVSRTQINKVLDELEYQQSGLCGEECAIKVGRHLSAQKVIIGTVGLLGRVYSIQLKLIDVESGEIEKIKSIQRECEIGQLPGYVDNLVREMFSFQVNQEIISDVGKIVQTEQMPLQTWKEPITGMEFVWVPSGEFEMGSIGINYNEEPLHRVDIDGFWMKKYEVTQGEWQMIMGNNPSHFKNGSNFPVEQVSWNDIQEFIGKLNNHTGITFLLPTEAEWEYACRAGTRGENNENLDNVAWYNKNSKGATHPVGQKNPNAWGIYDMLGNVWEWCQDRYGTYSIGYVRNPTGSLSGTSRVLRGGSWYNRAQFVRASLRSYDNPSSKRINLGFRIVKTK